MTPEPLAFGNLHAEEALLSQEDLPVIDYYNINKAARVLRALNHRLRQQIIKTIAENKRITVTDLFVRLRLEQSVASQHLAILRLAGIVVPERSGKFIYYRISADRIASINHLSDGLINA